MSIQFEDWKLKLSVALLLILGTTPSQSHGIPPNIACFHCDGGPECDNPSKGTGTRDLCLSENKACSKTGVPGAMKRGCYSRAQTRCIRDNLAFTDFHDAQGASCYNAIVHKDLTEEIEKCITGKQEVPQEPPLSTYTDTTLCVCLGEYCNHGPAEVVVDNTTTTTAKANPTTKRGSGGKENSAGQSTSNWKLISGVIMNIAAIYTLAEG